MIEIIYIRFRLSFALTFIKKYTIFFKIENTCFYFFTMVFFNDSLNIVFCKFFNQLFSYYNLTKSLVFRFLNLDHGYATPLLSWVRQIAPTFSDRSQLSPNVCFKNYMLLDKYIIVSKFIFKFFIFEMITIIITIVIIIKMILIKAFIK